MRAWAKAREDKTGLPPAGMRYLQLETAAAFGVPIDEFARRPLLRQAEMIAHLLVKGVREEYAAERLRQSAERDERSPAKGWNPMEAQRRAWKLS